jgi:hypothetical protein
MTEEWRRPLSAPEFEVSSLGRVKRAGRLIRGSVWSTGYIYVQTTVGATAPCGKRALGVHVLVCEAFHGPRPFPRAIPLHGDGGRNNNAASNLRWGTHKENASDRRRHGRDRLGADHHGARLIDEHEVIAIFVLRRRGLTGEEIAEAFGLNRNHVNKVLAQTAWAHVQVPDSLLIGAAEAQERYCGRAPRHAERFKRGGLARAGAA